MIPIKGHFDGAGIILDEPATLAAGQPVLIIPEPLPADLAELARLTDAALKSTRESLAATGISDDDLADWLEAETHAMRGIPYDAQG